MSTDEFLAIARRKQRVQPIRQDGKEYYVAFVSVDTAARLVEDKVYTLDDIKRFAEMVGAGEYPGLVLCQDEDGSCMIKMTSSPEAK